MTDESTNPISLADQGFVMPPEWHPHVATWMAWPHNAETWPENRAEAQREYIELVAAIAEDEPVMLMCSGEESVDQFLTAVSQREGKVTNVYIVDIPTNDAWARDYAPTFVINRETNEQIGVDWFYNAWGGKYPPFDLDQKASKSICQKIVQSRPMLGPGCTHHPVDFCIEGGAIEVNESGVLLCTKSCALDPKRNRKVTEEKVERVLLDNLGGNAIVWLAGDAITGDDTDGHIDQLARFAPTGAVLYADCLDQSDSQHELLKGNLQDLQRGFMSLGMEKDLIALPLPKPIQLHGQRLPASYCNFYITNNKVIVPEFGQRSDAEAIRIVSEHFVDRDVIGLPSGNLAFGQGSFHCLTQQQPGLV
jgi:agmatine deiminase